MTSDVKEKTYFHRTPGASFYMPDGRSFNFSPDDGHYTTSDEAVIKEMDKIANVPASHVYTTEPVAPAEERQVVKEIMQTATQTTDTINKNPPGTETVEIPQGKQAKPTLASSPVAAAAQPASAAAKIAAARAAVHAEPAKPVQK